MKLLQPHTRDLSLSELYISLKTLFRQCRFYRGKNVSFQDDTDIWDGERFCTEQVGSHVREVWKPKQTRSEMIGDSIPKWNSET